MAKIKQISVSEFKAKSLALFQIISTGELTVIVTKRGKPLAKIEAVLAESGNIPGTLRSTVLAEDDIVSPMGAKEWRAAK